MNTENKSLSMKEKLCVAMYDLFAWKAKKTQSNIQIYLTNETTYSLTHI